VQVYPYQLSHKARTKFFVSCLEVSLTRVVRYAMPDGALRIDPARASEARARAPEFHIEIEPLLGAAWEGMTSAAAWEVVLHEVLRVWAFLNLAED
jgi:hypothetical protein